MRRCALIDHLGIDQLFCVIGGSMGGMQVLEWAARHGERVFTAVPIATAAWHSSQNIAFHEVGRQAVMADPELARRRLSASTARCRATGSPWRAWPRTSPTFRRRRCSASSAAACRTSRAKTFCFNADFQVESYLRHQGSTFVDRFDANSYLYITRAMDYFDLAAEHGGVLANAFKRHARRASAWSPSPATGSIPTRESREIVHALNAVAANV